MNLRKLYGLHILTLLILLKLCSCLEDYETCNLIPLQSKTSHLPPDNRFAIEIVGVEDEYIPRETYTVRLYATDEQSTFIAFTISVKGETKPNDKNPRKPTQLSPGEIRDSPNANVRDTISRAACLNTVFEANKLPKSSVEAQWIAPPKGNQCVTVFAYVAVKADVWYSSDGPLSKRVCEDHRKLEDMKPKENPDCRVCEEARYELHFQGSWSFNTHPRMYPNSSTATFSDIVGASHNNKFILYKDNTEATSGLKMLAEQGNTTSLEHEILKYLGTNVRTVIKANGPFTPSHSTITSFRTSSQHHFISLAASIIPSPDWFLGVYNMELCNADTGNWTNRVLYNLYPMDAGTDSGLSFETAPEPTTPAQVITKAKIADVPSDKMMPFAKLTLTLVRTYENPNCVQQVAATPKQEDNGDGTGDTGYEEPDPIRPNYKTTTSPPIQIEPADSEGCQTTAWDEWLPCEAECVDNKVSGYQTRVRYYVIDGQRVEDDTEIPEQCMQIEISESRKCEDDCDPVTSEEGKNMYRSLEYGKYR